MMLTGAQGWCATAILITIIVPHVAGCSDGRPKRVPVAGQVLLDGKPLTMGFVRFIPEGARVSTGNIDENGHFTLSCFGDDDGAVIGSHHVEVTACQILSETSRRWYAPKTYADLATSNLTQKITGPTSDVVINLSWDGGKPFVEVDQQMMPPESPEIIEKRKAGDDPLPISVPVSVRESVMV